MPDKPPFAIPTMAEVEATAWNGLTVASTFAGAGGSCTGYRMAGFRIAWANEFEPTAAACYRANHPGTVLDVRSIREVRGQDILDAVGPVDVLDGSPPCQSFSMAGQRSDGWGKVMAHADGTTQRSDDLFFEYGRLLGELRPRAFVAENVKGLVIGSAKGMFKEIMAMLADQGYVVRARLLDAQWLGVPQHRERVIIVGTRDDLGLEPVYPLPLPWRYSMMDACPWFAGAGHLQAHDETGWGEQLVGLDAPAPTVLAGQGTRGSNSHPVLVVPRGTHGFTPREYDMDDPSPTIVANQQRTDAPTLNRRGHGFFPGADVSPSVPAPTVTAMGGAAWGTLEVEGANGFDGYAGSSVGEPMPTVQAGRPVALKTTNRFAKQADTDGPSPTVLATNAGWSDIAVEKRSLTIDEVKRLCSFPDDYVLLGNYNQQWARLGNSVPPLMMRAVARELAAVLADGTAAADA